jgi:hypothetical protein
MLLVTHGLRVSEERVIGSSGDRVIEKALLASGFSLLA